jgi:hypothetical protein
LVTILIITDEGQVFAMSDGVKSCLKCLESVKKNTHATYLADTGKRLAYLGRAWEKIEGAGISE